MSNFKKITPNKEDPIKACFGHPELDALFGNSLLKGQLVFIEQDAPTTIYKQLLRYALGNAYHSQQTSILFDQDPQHWLRIIPQKQIEKPQKEPQQPQEHKIAWRYQGMEAQFKIKNVDKNIARMDLSKEVAQVEQQLFHLNNYSFRNVKELLQQISQAYQKSLRSSTDSSLKKLLLHQLFEELETEDDVTLFLYGLKVLVRSSFMLCIISVPNDWAFKPLLYPFCDFYVSVTQIFGNKEFSEFQGFIRIEKVGQGGCIKQVNLEIDKWGLKVSSKDVVLEMLYETAVQEESDEESKQKKRLACGAKPQDKDLLEF